MRVVDRSRGTDRPVTRAVVACPVVAAISVAGVAAGHLIWLLVFALDRADRLTHKQPVRPVTGRGQASPSE